MVNYHGSCKVGHHVLSDRYQHDWHSQMDKWKGVDLGQFILMLDYQYSTSALGNNLRDLIWCLNWWYAGMVLKSLVRSTFKLNLGDFWTQLCTLSSELAIFFPYTTRVILDMAQSLSWLNKEELICFFLVLVVPSTTRLKWKLQKNFVMVWKNSEGWKSIWGYISLLMHNRLKSY